jgi:flagellar biosynthesis anti-sigma factor FlgM
MRIIDRYAALGTDAGQRAAATSKARPDPAGRVDTTAPDVPSAVKVTVSPRARELADAAASSDGAIDDAKVARLRSAVDAGTLDVDSAKIAQAVVNGD